MALSPEAEARQQATREALALRNAEHGEVFSMMLNLEQCEDLAAGHVPLAVKAMALTLLEWEDAARQNAEKPIRRRA